MTKNASHKTRKKHRSWRRRLLVVALAVPLLLLVTRLWVVQGLWVPVRVSGDSMAPALVGRHWQLVCDDCGFPFDISRKAGGEERWALCPNCGWRHNDLRLASAEPGQRVLLGKLPLWLSPPRRWQVVAVRTPGYAEQLSVKRIVGLPGEEIAIRQGDIYVDGEIVRKSLAELRGVAVPVYLDAYRTTIGELAARWQPDRTPSPWRRIAGGYECAAETSREIEWLTYRNWACQPPPGQRTAEIPTLDDYGYNQSLSRSLNEVTDLLVATELRLAGSGRLVLLAHDGREKFELSLRVEEGVARQVELSRGGQAVLELAVDCPLDEPALLELALCDRQVLLAVGGRVLCRYPYETAELPLAPSARPLAIGLAGLRAELKSLGVYRDLYYLDPNGLAGSWASESPLGDDEFLLLGDNCPVSVDGRNWPAGGVQAADVVGRVWPEPGGAAGR